MQQVTLTFTLYFNMLYHANKIFLFCSSLRISWSLSFQYLPSEMLPHHAVTGHMSGGEGDYWFGSNIFKKNTITTIFR